VGHRDVPAIVWQPGPAVVRSLCSTHQWGRRAIRNRLSATGVKLSERMNRAILALLCALTCMLAFAHRCSAQSEFEVRHEEAVSRNPAGVKLELRTADGRSSFHLFETIPIELEFSSSRAATYSIELDEAMNFAGQANWFDVSPRDTVFVPYSAMGHRGVVCCELDRHYLSPRPTILRRELTDYLRFEKAGTYSVVFATGRVFRGMGAPNNFSASGLRLTSNILTLTILPDDPKWDSQRLEEVLRTLSDSRVRANYSAALDLAGRTQTETGRDWAMANRVNQTELVHAQQALNALDTDEAIQQRVRFMKMESKPDLEEARRFGGGDYFDQPVLESTTRADLVVGAMRKLAERPGFFVDYDYVQWWAEYVVQRDHPELFRPVASQAEREAALRSYQTHNDEAQRELATTLEDLLSSKTPEAAEITRVTIGLIRSFTGRKRRR